MRRSSGWLALCRLHLGLYNVPAGCARARRVDVARALPPYSARPRADDRRGTDCAFVVADYNAGEIVNREQRGSVELGRSSSECIGDFESTEESFSCPDFRVTTWALCIDPPFAKLIRGSWFAKVVVMPERSTEEIRELLDSLYRVDSGRILATLIRLLGDFDLAEEAMHEAFAAA